MHSDCRRVKPLPLCFLVISPKSQKNTWFKQKPCDFL
nr:MAG TPA: hypothetical protein [Caudoviricetes sp.]